MDPARIELERLQQRVDQQASQLAEQSAEIERLIVDRDGAFRNGQKAGHAAGLDEAERQHHDLLAVLTQQTGKALAAFETSLSALESHAGTLAQVALGRVLGDPERYQELMAEVIRTQLSALAANSAVIVEVSSIDFATPDVLSVLQSEVRHRGAEFVALEGRASGSCTIRLRMGAVEADIDQQWNRLRLLLSSPGEK